MLNLDLESYVRLGPIHFGMTREDVRRTIGQQVKTFRKGSSVTLTDAFDELGIHVYYDAKDLCEAIEVFPPAVPVVRGKRLLGIPYGEALAWLKSIDSVLSGDGASIAALTVGFAVYASGGEREPDEPIEALMAFRQGYYDSEDEAQ